MAKMKAPNGSGKVPNKALHSRVSFLYQAAAYLATHQQHSEGSGDSTAVSIERSKQLAGEPARYPAGDVEASLGPGSRRLASDLRSVSLKAQLRISPQMKHSICKNCDTFLIDGSTCTNEVENRSNGGKKHWADVLVRKCNTCEFVKRYPLAAARQKRRHLRVEKEEISVEVTKTG